MEQLLNTVFIAIGIFTGIVGIIFLAKHIRRLRTVGVLIFPLMPAIILFVIIFPTSSDASLQYLGKLSGPIAAYIVVALLARRFVEKDISAEEKQENIETLQGLLKSAENDLKQTKEELQHITSRYKELNKSIETARPKPLSSGSDLIYYHPQDRQRQIIIRTGDIRNVRNIDVIVNSENTDMVPARIYDTAISGALRYLDAEIGNDGYVIRDCMFEKLQEEIRSKGARLPVRAGVVFATPTTRLNERGVKYIFHTAAVKGEIGAGYQPIVEQLDQCIQNCYRKFTEIHSQGKQIATLLFPLLGAGSAKLSPQDAANLILPEIIRGMTDVPQVQATYILAWVESHKQALLSAAQKLHLEVANATAQTGSA